jgi:hypothetical protein
LLYNCWVANITSSSYGGFLNATGVRLELAGCVFENIQAFGHGGVIYGNSLVTGSLIRLCCASNSQAGSSGGFFGLDSCHEVNLVDVQITATSSAGSIGGGFIAHSGDNQIDCLRVNFTKTTGGNYGAAAGFYEGSGGGLFVGCYFWQCSGCRAVIDSLYGNHSISINASIFIGNSGYAAGVSAGAAFVSDCYIEGTSEFLCDYGSLTIQRCYFNGTSITTSGAMTDLGGHIYSTVTRPNLDIGTYIIQCPLYGIIAEASSSLEESEAQQMKTHGESPYRKRGEIFRMGLFLFLVLI